MASLKNVIQDENGKVGVGIVSPEEKIQLHESSSGQNYIKITNDTTGSTGGNGILLGLNSSEDYIIWNYEATNMRFATSGSERMRISSSGRLGIGTTNPAYHIHGLSAESGWGYSFQNATGDEDVNVYMSHGGGYGIAVDSTENASDKYLLKLSGGTGGGAGIGSVTRMIVTAAGNVGIGTTSPSEKLHVAGSVEITAGDVNLDAGRAITFYGNSNTNHSISSTSSTGGSADDIRINSYGAIYFNLDSNNNNTSGADFQIARHGGTSTLSDYLFTLSGETGNVGIGTTSPDRNLHIYQGNSGVTGYTITGGIDIESTSVTGINILSPNAGYGRIYFGAPISSTAGAIEYIHNATLTSGYMKLRAGGADRVFILGNGNVGIGTTSPADKLHVAVSSGNYQVGGDSSGNIYHKSQSGEHRFRADGGTTNAFTIANSLVSTLKTAYFSSNVGIGTSSPGAKLHTVLSNGQGTPSNFSGNVATFQTNNSTGYAAYISVIGGDTGASGILFGDKDAMNRGMIRYNHASDYLGIGAAGNSTSLVIDSSGNVGIGTTSPSSLLQVAGTITAPTLLTVNDATVLDNTNIQPAQGEVEDIVKFKWSGTQVASIDNEGNYTGGLTTTSNVGIGILSPTSKLHINNSVSDPDLDIPVSYAVEIDSNHSGSTATTSDREQGALYIDLDSSTTGGDTSNEHRVWAIYSDTRFSGDADDAAAGFFKTEQNSTAGTSTWVRGAYGYAISDGGASASVSNLIGVDGLTNSQDATPINNSIGVEGTSYVHANRTGNITNVIGGSFEAEFNSDSMSVTDGTAILGVIDTNTDASVTNNRLLHLYYDGASTATNTWSIYSESDYPSYFAGNVGIGTTSPGKKLEVREAADIESSIRIRQLSYNYWDLKSPASDTGFTIGDVGGEKMRITSTGNVGIGTTSPSRKLHVVSSEWDNTAGGGVIFENSNTVGASLTLKPSSSAVTYGRSGWAVYAGGPGAAIGDGNLGFWAHETNQARMVIQRAGNVGIGTTSPEAKLHVNANLLLGDRYTTPGTSSWTTSNSQLVIGGAHNSAFNTGTKVKLLITGYDNDGSTIYPIYAEDENGLVDFWIKNRQGGTAAPTMYFAGKVGIGTTSPSETLSVAGNIAIVSNNSAISFNTSASANDPKIQMGSDGDFSFINTAGSTNLHIENSGNVGIGTTSPGYKLDVSGGAIAIRGNAAGNSLRFDDSGGTSRNAMYLDTSNYLNIGNSNYAGVKFAQTATMTASVASARDLSSLITNTTTDDVALGTPDAWLAVRIGTTDYAIPMYSV